MKKLYPGQDPLNMHTQKNHYPVWLTLSLFSTFMLASSFANTPAKVHAAGPLPPAIHNTTTSQTEPVTYTPSNPGPDDYSNAAALVKPVHETIIVHHPDTTTTTVAGPTLNFYRSVTVDPTKVDSNGKLTAAAYQYTDWTIDPSGKAPTSGQTKLTVPSLSQDQIPSFAGYTPTITTAITGGATMKPTAGNISINITVTGDSGTEHNSIEVSRTIDYTPIQSTQEKVATKQVNVTTQLADPVNTQKQQTITFYQLQDASGVAKSKWTTNPDGISTSAADQTYKLPALAVQQPTGYEVDQITTDVDGKQYAGNGSVTITPADAVVSRKVTFKPLPKQSVSIAIINDATNQTLAVDTITGQIGSAIDFNTINREVAWQQQGYRIVSDDTQKPATFGSQPVTYYVHVIPTKTDTDGTATGTNGGDGNTSTGGTSNAGNNSNPSDGNTNTSNTATNGNLINGSNNSTNVDHPASGSNPSVTTTTNGNTADHNISGQPFTNPNQLNADQPAMQPDRDHELPVSSQSTERQNASNAEVGPQAAKGSAEANNATRPSPSMPATQAATAGATTQGSTQPSASGSQPSTTGMKLSANEQASNQTTANVNQRAKGAATGGKAASQQSSQKRSTSASAAASNKGNRQALPEDATNGTGHNINVKPASQEKPPIAFSSKDRNPNGGGAIGPDDDVNSQLAAYFISLSGRVNFGRLDKVSSPS